MISFVTNVDSLVAQQNLRVNSNFQSKTIQQLTSGYRINSSGDDAAGLAVANNYRNSISELTQGVRNANDGVSQLQIIDGGLSNISQILDRMQTLATESASDTFTGDRATVNREYQSLITEIDRQAENIGLGDHNSVNSKLLKVYIGGGQDSNTNASVNVDLSSSIVSSTGLGLANTSVLTNAAVLVGAAAKAVKIANADNAVFTIATTSGVHTITVNGHPNDTLDSQMADLNSQLQGLNISASLDQAGKLQFTSSSAFTVSAKAGTAANLVSTTAEKAVNTGLNNFAYTPGQAEKLQIAVGGTTVTVDITSTTITQSMVDAINSALKSNGVSGVNAVLDENAGPTATINFQGSTTFTMASDGGLGGAFTDLGLVTTGQTAGDPNVAINAIAAAVKNLGYISGKVGTGENTLNYAINLAQSQISSFSSAQSQIRDADVAAQAANLTKAQVLQQASIAAMAQANAEPQAVLSLLKQ
ncbi:MAG: flagellin [Bryobacteraceae bacterium]